MPPSCTSYVAGNELQRRRRLRGVSVLTGDTDDYEWGFLAETSGEVWDRLYLTSKQTLETRWYAPDDPHLGALYEEGVVYAEPDLSAEDGYDFPSTLVVKGRFPRNRAVHTQLYRARVDSA